MNNNPTALKNQIAHIIDCYTVSTSAVVQEPVEQISNLIETKVREAIEEALTVEDCHGLIKGAKEQALKATAEVFK